MDICQEYTEALGAADDGNLTKLIYFFGTIAKNIFEEVLLTDNFNFNPSTNS
jgi:hypothetical protein